MKLTEALGILKKNGAIISEANKVDAGYDHRGWARYGFNSPNKNRGYVKMLNFLYHAENGMSKKDIHNWMGLSTAPGNHSATWTEMSDAGLAKYDKHEQVWKITTKGRKYLEDNDLVIDFKELTEPYDKAGGAGKSSKELRNELVDIVAKAGGLTRREICSAMDLDWDVCKNILSACLHAGEIEWDDDAGVFKAVEANAENLKKEFLEVLKRKHTLTYEEAAEELGVSIKQAVAAGNEWIKAGVVDWSPNNQVFFIPKNDKKPSGDDDDMYDDTPIVKQRDESFFGFLKQNGYRLVEDTDDSDDLEIQKDEYIRNRRRADRFGRGSHSNYDWRTKEGKARRDLNALDPDGYWARDHYNTKTDRNLHSKIWNAKLYNLINALKDAGLKAAPHDYYDACVKKGKHTWYILVDSENDSILVQDEDDEEYTTVNSIDELINLIG